MRSASCVLALCGALACAHAEPAEQLVDLSYPFDTRTIYWPTEGGFVLEGDPGHVTGTSRYWPERGASRRFETHQALLGANVPALENVASLDLLPPRDFRVAALPMKIGGGTGAPLRGVAFVPQTAP